LLFALFGGALRPASWSGRRSRPPGISNVQKGVNSQPGTPPGATRRKHKHPQQVRKPHGSGLAEVTKGRWSGWRLAAIVVAFPLRMAFFSSGGGKIKQSILNITTHYAPDLPEWQGVRA
jgi:hypothetical protein